MSSQAQLYRLYTDDHICPFGIKSRDLLKRRGVDFEDCLLTDSEQADRFQQRHGVETTPQTFIDGERIGGYQDLRRYFGLDEERTADSGPTYRPVLVIFAVAALMTLALNFGMLGQGISPRMVVWFVAISMCLLAVQKLRDVTAFSNQFLPYDLLARRWVPYAYLYPYAELFAGLGMLAGVLIPLVAAIAAIIGAIGTVSVIKAVYIEGRQLRCACAGGGVEVPLGPLSLVENLMMLAMGTWMLTRWGVL